MCWVIWAKLDRRVALMQSLFYILVSRPRFMIRKPDVIDLSVYWDNHAPRMTW